MDIVYRKKQFLTRVFKNIESSDLFRKIIISVQRVKMSYTQHEILALNTYLSSFSKKSDDKIYNRFTAWHQFSVILKSPF